MTARVLTVSVLALVTLASAGCGSDDGESPFSLDETAACLRATPEGKAPIGSFANGFHMLLGDRVVADPTGGTRFALVWTNRDIRSWTTELIFFGLEDMAERAYRQLRQEWDELLSKIDYEPPEEFSFERTVSRERNVILRWDEAPPQRLVDLVLNCLTPRA